MGRQAQGTANRQRRRTRGTPTVRLRVSPGETGGNGSLRVVAFILTALAILGVGVALAGGDLLGQRGAASTAAAIPVRMSMAGYTPAEIHVKAGEPVTIELWTTDAAPHLKGGIHTLISDELGLYETVAAESRSTFNFTAPAKPGDYDFYCDTCCGGRASPTMHGTLHVTA